MYKHIFLFLVFCSYSITGSATPPLQSFADIVEPLLPAVVNVYTTQHKKQNKVQNRMHIPNGIMPFDQLQEFFDNMQQFGFDESRTRSILGSGFIIDSSGYIVTNHHVVESADEIFIKMGETVELKATLVGSDKRTDLALLKVESKNPLPFVKFGDSNVARVGDIIITIGNPFGLGSTVTSGIISFKGRDISLDSSGIVDNYIQTDAAINSGNSGGPMFNMQGEVIGVNTAILSPYGSGTNIGIGFAIPSSTAISVISDLKENGKVNRGILNIKVQEVSDEMAEALGLDNTDGAFVADVEPNGAGAKAGIKVGDIVLSFNDMNIKSARKLKIAVAESKIGSVATITVLRDGKKRELKCTITPDHEIKSEPSKNKANKNHSTFEKYGIVFSNLSPELSKNYGFNSTDSGIVITELQHSKNSWQGLRVGDLVIGVNQQYISNIEEFEKAYEASKNKARKNIVLIIKRNGMSLSITLPL